MTSSVTGRTRELTFPKIPTVSTAFGKRRHNCARISIHVLPSCGGQLYRRIFKATPSRTRWAFHPYPGCRFSSTSFMVQVQAVKQVSVQIDPIFLIGPVGCLSAGLFPFIYCSPGYPYYTRCRLVSSMPNLFIFSAKFDCLLLVLSRPAFSVLLKNLPFRPAESVFFAPSLAGLLVNLRA